LSEDDPSDDNEYLTLGSSPPTEYAPSFVEPFEEPNLELNPQLCNDTIRSGLIDQMRSSYGRIKLYEDIEDGSIIAENVIETFEAASQKEKNLCFLWSAFLKRWDLLEGLLQVCAELSYHEQGGFSAIHLAAFSGCLTSVSYLLYRGADVNYQPKYFTPLHCTAFGNAYEAAKLLISHGAKISINTKTRHLEESLLHCAVRANAIGKALKKKIILIYF
jgi:ankyrin repeat protein